MSELQHFCSHPFAFVGLSFVSTYCWTVSRNSTFAPDLEPAFENLLRTLSVGEALITALKVSMINDRETFVGLDETEAGFKNIALYLGIDLVNGGLAQKREMSRLISAWKQARIASEAKQQVDAVTKAYDPSGRRLDVYDVGLPDKIRKAFTG